jgi:tungstate transport system ATP-binding protein
VIASSEIVSLHDVQVRRGDKVILDVPSLMVRTQETLAVIGPNGAGKSTLLRVLASLAKPRRGRLVFRGRTVRPGDLAYRRRIALVLQEPMLLNASVLGNVTLGLRFRRVAGAVAASRAITWLERLGVAHLRDRPARTLSGGEAQRVSLARAMVLEPELLLLDEPFSALDPPTRVALLDDLLQLLKETRTTTVFVTHDRDEALQLGDRVAVLLGGQIRQLDTPERVFAAPADQEVATFVGVETVLAGRIVDGSTGLAIVEIGTHQVEVATDGAVGDEVLVCLRPEDVTLTPGDVPLLPSSARNRLPGQVTRVVPKGRLYHVTVDCGFPLVAMITPQSVQGLGLEPGREVIAAFKATAAHAIRRG